MVFCQEQLAQTAHSMQHKGSDILADEVCVLLYTRVCTAVCPYMCECVCVCVCMKGMFVTVCRGCVKVNGCYLYYLCLDLARSGQERDRAVGNGCRFP